MYKNIQVCKYASMQLCQFTSRQVNLLYEASYLRFAIRTGSETSYIQVAISRMKIVTFRDYSATRNFYFLNKKTQPNSDQTKCYTARLEIE